MRSGFIGLAISISFWLSLTFLPQNVILGSIFFVIYAFLAIGISVPIFVSKDWIELHIPSVLVEAKKNKDKKFTYYLNLTVGVLFIILSVISSSALTYCIAMFLHGYINITLASVTKYYSKYV